MSIDDWFADRADGSFGDASDDEVVEFTAFAEIPPEFPDEPLQRRVPEEDLDALRRRNGLPARRPLPELTRRTADIRPADSPPAEVPVPGLPWHLRSRILDAARLRGPVPPRVIATDVRLKGADVTTAQVAEVLRSLTPSERQHGHGRRTAVQRDARQVPRHLGRPLPQPAPSPQPRPRPVTRPVRSPETCPACGVLVSDRGLCGCS